MNSTATTNRGFRAIVGAVAHAFWSGADEVFAALHQIPAIIPMPAAALVNKGKDATYHRPSGGST